MKCIELDGIGFLSNSYILYDESTKEAAIIDPSLPLATYKEYSDDLSLLVKYILITHTHFDHIWHYDDVSASYGIVGFSSETEIQNANDPRYNASYLVQREFRINNPIYNSLQYDLKLGTEEINTISTPGHTAGSISVYSNGMLFSGDLIFREGIGRWDLAGGDYKCLQDSVNKVINLCSADTIIYPGHGEHTTVEHETKYNPYLNW